MRNLDLRLADAATRVLNRPPRRAAREPDVARPQVVVVGGGFAGFYALRRLQRSLPPEAADLVLVNPTDYLLYSPLLPEVATGVVEARHVAISLRRVLPRVRLVLGRAAAVALEGRTVTVAQVSRTGADATTNLHWDRLALTPGSVTREFQPVPVQVRSGISTGARNLRDR